MKTPSVHWKQTLGKRLDRISHDVFDVFRWMLTIGFARYAALKTGSGLFLAVSYGLMAVLLIFLMSVFLLRGDVTVFHADTSAARIGNTVFNITLCVGAFALCLWLTFALVNDFVLFQES